MSEAFFHSHSLISLTREITVVDPSLFQFRIVSAIIFLDGKNCFTIWRRWCPPQSRQVRIVSARELQRLRIDRDGGTDPVPPTIRVRRSRRGAHHWRFQTRDALFGEAGASSDRMRCSRRTADSMSGTCYWEQRRRRIHR